MAGLQPKCPLRALIYLKGSCWRVWLCSIVKLFMYLASCCCFWFEFKWVQQLMFVREQYHLWTEQITGFLLIFCFRRGNRTHLFVLRGWWIVIKSPLCLARSLTCFFICSRSSSRRSIWTGNIAEEKIGLKFWIRAEHYFAKLFSSLMDCVDLFSEYLIFSFILPLFKVSCSSELAQVHFLFGFVAFGKTQTVRWFFLLLSYVQTLSYSCGCCC